MNVPRTVEVVYGDGTTVNVDLLTIAAEIVDIPGRSETGTMAEVEAVFTVEDVPPLGTIVCRFETVKIAIALLFEGYKAVLVTQTSGTTPDVIPETTISEATYLAETEGLTVDLSYYIANQFELVQVRKA